jgi:hypothetical protein
MIKNLSSKISVPALAAALLILPAIAAVSASAADPVAQVLATSGTVPVKDAGPYVHVGSYRIHVWTMLGRPSAVLPDGTWFYKDYSADASSALGTLVVRFADGQVSQLSLVSPTVATAMLNAPAQGQGVSLVTRR